MNNVIPSIEKAKTAINLIGGIEALAGEDRRYISRHTYVGNFR